MQTMMIRITGMVLGVLLLIPTLVAQQSQTASENNDQVLALQNQMPDEDSEAYTILNQVVELNFQNASLEEALNAIANQANLKLMYRKTLLPDDKKITYRNSSKTVYDALWDILDGTGIQFAISQNRQLVLLQMMDAQSVLDLELQQETVTGTVVDAETGESLPGVNVAIEGTTTGTTTNEDGEYSLEVGDLGEVLVFSFVGYQTQRIEVADQEVIDVRLVVGVGLMDEVIVVGYGTVQRSDLTGSVERVRAETFQNQSMTQLGDMLTGTISGFYSQQNTSAAGGSSMEIRGPQSLLASTEPLIVLDGVIYNGSLRDINPNDIETIDILKDASSAAIFGAKAASGVVLITTSRGRIGRPLINFSMRTGLAESANHHRPLDGEEFLQFRGDYLRTIRGFDNTPSHYYTHPEDLPDNINIDEWSNYSESPNPDPIREYLNRHLLSETEREQYLAGESANWYDMVIGSGLRQDYDLSISGGTENARYYWSVGYNDNEGIIRGDKFTAIRSRLNVDFQIADWFSVGANSQLTNRDESAVPASLSRTYRISPWGRAKNEDGTINLEPQELITAEHPLMEVYGQERERNLNTFFSSIYAELILPFELEYRLSFQPRFTNMEDYNFYGDQHAVGYRDHSGGFGTRAVENSYEWMVDNILSWNQDFGIHSFDVTLLHSIEQFRTRSNRLENESFSPNQNLSYHALQFGNNPHLTNYDTKATGDALMARLNYTLLNKYLLTASIRRDGYSAFGQDKPRATFPAVALAWQISEENFFNIDLVNSLKLRLSWGVNGNRDIGIYSSLAQLSANPYYDGSNVQVGTTTSSMANPLLAWEKTESYNIGLDISLLNNRIDLNLDVYNSITNDLLMERQVPRITGFQNITTNLGQLNNRGIEATLRTVNISLPNLTWRTDFNFTINRNEIKALFGDVGEYTILGESRNGELPDFTNEWFPGQAIDVVWNYDIIGVWQENEADEAALYGLRPGDFKAVDVSGNGSYVDVQDKRFIGHTDPRFRIGLRNEVSFLNWHVSMFIRGDIGHIGNFGSALYGSSEFDRFSMSARPVPYWTPENPINDYSRLDHSSNLGAFGGGISIYRPRTFVRIQDLSLSYNLPSAIAQRLQLQNLRLFGSIRNLYSFDNWPGFDPESGANPMPRIYTTGIELSL